MKHKRQLVTPAITLTPHIHTKQQLNTMTKKGLIRLVVKLEKFIIYHAYKMYKSKLPRLRKTKLKGIEYKKDSPKLYEEIERYERKVKRRKKRKFSRKQLAAQRLFAKRARAGTLRRR